MATTLKGEIADIRYRNEENGYSILTIDVAGEPVVCVGTFGPVTEGEPIEVSGSFIVHPKFGRQFKVESVKTSEPDNEDGIIRFLGAKIIKGIGPKKALSIVAKFGKDTLRILEFEPYKLSQVKGISPGMATEIGASYADIKGMREAVMFLQGLGLALATALKIYKVYGSDTQAIVKTNPYLLIEDVDRVGFLTADKIGLASGIKRDSPFRIRAGILHSLKETADKNGNTYLPKEQLVDIAKELLKVEDDLILNEIDRASFDKKLKVLDLSQDESVFDIDNFGQVAAPVGIAVIDVECDEVQDYNTSLYNIAEENDTLNKTPVEASIASLNDLDNEAENVSDCRGDILSLELNNELQAITRPLGVALMQYYRLEQSVAQKLTDMVAGSNTIRLDVRSLIENFERVEKIEFHATQIEAITASTSSGVSVITGGPGTGKTTIVKCILKVLEALNKSVMLMAPTGRAAKRLSDQTGATASTIHRALLSGGGTMQSGGKNNSTEKFSTDVVIVDEVSMVDIFLMNMLLNRIKPNTQLIMVGDKDQLPSVGAGNVLSDILSSGFFSVSKLEYVYRQEHDSLIVTNAHKINKGQMPNLAARSGDFFFSEASNPKDVADRVVQLVSERLPKFLNCDSNKIQVLAPMKNGEAGTIRLNERLAAILNTQADSRELATEYQRFRIGDKVMHIANNYDLEWRKWNGKFFEDGEGVFNGDAGVVENIDVKSGEIHVAFEDGRKAIYTPDIRSQLILSYAITIHKSQGSEFDACVIPLVAGNYMIMTRNLLYTAVTRAKKLVVLIGDRAVIKRVVDNNYIQKRYSYLKPLMCKCFGKIAKLYGENK